MPRYKATFPHMGTQSIAFKCLLNELGFDVTLPPPITRETISLGSSHTPEFACLPLKVNFGNYLEAIPSGVDIIFMAGGVGPCRFGLYGEVQREILRTMGYDLPFVVLEHPKNNLGELVEKFTRVLGNAFWRNLPRAAYLCWHKLAVMDRLDRKILFLAPRVGPENCRRLWRERRIFLQHIDQASEAGEMYRILRESSLAMDAYPQIKIKPLKIMLVGEIYVVLEPAVNFNMEETLSMMGIEVVRTIYFSRWVREQIFCSLFHLDWQRRLRAAARPYLTHFVGGHSVESVAHTALAAKEGINGVIQLAPLGCMPELVAMSILQQISKEKGIPVLSLLIDEHTSGTGVLTRLEAFVDLLEKKRKAV
ncbi:MAG: acyl-CoA dehydratase activase-related protein [Bacillota bacterium]